MVPFWSYRIKPISLEKMTEHYAKDELKQMVK